MTDTATRATLTRNAALASVVVACLLLVLKGYAARATGSVAMLGSLADTGLDLVASLVTLWAVRVAANPADTDHRFGHGKAEALAALFQVALIAVSAVAIGAQAIERFLRGAETASADTGIAVSIVAMAMTFALIAYQRRIVARTGSVAIRADSVHYSSDLALNGAVIVALLLDQYARIPGIDPAFGVAIAGWLLWGRGAAGQAVDQLMDKEWPEEKRLAFLKVAAGHPELRGIHDLRTRTSGAHDFVQFHVWVAPDMTVRQVHQVMDEVEAKLALAFPGTEILIHPDPEGLVDADGMMPVDETEALI